MYKACFFHDLRYWLGGTNDERLIADAKLIIDVVKLGIIKDRDLTETAQLMFAGVRVGGGRAWRKLRSTYSWGFGDEKTKTKTKIKGGSKK